MKCDVNVNLDNYKDYPVIKELANKYGASSTQFMNIFTRIMSESSDGYIPSDDFINWCKKDHKIDVDFTSSDENHKKEIIDLGNEYYAYLSGDSNLTAREEFINTTVSRFGYSSAKARDDAKLSCIKIILDIHRNSMYNVDRQNALGIKDRYDRAILLAYEIIDSSVLSDEEKNAIKNEIQDSSVTTEEQVRRILHNNDLPSKFNVYGKNRKYYSRELRKAIRTLLVQRAMNYSGLSQNEVMSILASNDNLANRLFPSSNQNEDERNKCLNLLALHEEASRVRFVNKNDKNDVIDLAEYKTKSNRNDYVQDESFYDDILKNSKLEFLRNESKSEFNDEDDILAVNVIETEETDDDASNETPVDDDVDVSISLYEHMGTFKSAMLHCSKDIIQYLNSLPVLNSPNINDEDRSNDVGLPISMNANFCATMLNHWTDKTTPDAFHDSIKRLASMPGCGGLIVLYDAMTKDYNLKYLFYSTFGKTLMPKSEVRQDGDSRKTVISNLKSIKSEAFKQELLNSVRSSIPTIDIDVVDELYKKIDTTQFKMTADSYAIKSVIGNIYKVFRLYYPCINEDELIHYVYNHKTDGKININGNLQQLNNILSETITASRESIENYENMIANIREAYSEQREKNKDSEAVLPGFGSSKKVKDIDISDYYYDYLSNKQKTQIMSLADVLVDHVVIKVENNSISPLGNQSSDIINSNYITAMMKVLQDNVMLEKYGKFKFQSRQYDFSNILFEHKDDKGVIINYGLFTRDLNGDIKPTSYANKLLSIHMYNGAKNFNEDNGLTYAMHSKGDYIAAAYTMFHNPAEGAIKGASAIDVNLAEYLMRTPADAQHNFTVTAPKYSTTNLFKISNEEDIIAEKSNIKNGIINRIRAYTIKNAEQSTYNIRQLYNHLTSDKFALKLNRYKENGIQSITLAYKLKNNKDKTDNYLKYTVTGVVKEGVLYYDSSDNNCSITIASTTNDDSLLVETIMTQFEPLIINKLEREGKIKYKVNAGHHILKQLSQNFEQELLDMAVAIDTFFETDSNGAILFDGDMPKFKNVEKGIIADGRQIDGAYDNYHFKTTTDKNGVKHGYLIEKTNGDIDKSVYKLTGNVFKSDKFTVWGVNDNGEETTINYGQRIVDELYDLLYGGASGRNLKTVKEDGKLKVILNDEQRAVINKHLSDYLLALTEDASKRLYEFEHLMQDGIELNNANIADFIINYHLAYNNFNDLFEGDSKFYKDSRTFLKRAKEVQGSGVPYGIANFLNVFDTERREITDAPIQPFAKEYKVKMYNKFRGATIVNTVTHNEQTLQIIKNKLKEASLSEDAAETIIDGHRRATVNDAQSYISFDEWIRRITARGQLDKYRPLINKIINGEKLIGSELTEFVQVQKNFYYAQDFDTRSRVFAPNQIKNAEFVLIPQLIEGTELELVAKLMNKYGIDQLNTEETSKAGKTNTLTIFDPKTGELLSDIIEEMTGDGSTVSEFGKTIGIENGRGIKLYSYEFLYTQQETPQHLDAKNKAGIQIMKKIIDNLPNDTSELGILKKRFIDSYCNNIKTSAFELFKELGLPIDEKTGNLKLTKNTVDNFNFEVFYDKLRHELFRLGYDSNMIDYITLDENQVMKNGDITLMPNYMTMVGQKLENIAQSVFNNSITRQKLPGFHAAQITNVGLKAYGEGKENIGVCKDLKYHVDDKENYVDYIEIKLPKSAFHFKRTNKDGSLKDDQTLLDELKEEGLDYVIGYRIPTEGKQSICKMKIVGFIDDAFGSTIVVPNEWVSQTGSDFDIDSVYGIQHATYIDKKTGKIRKCGDKSKYKNTNTIVDCMLDILAHPKCLEENVSQSNFRAITGAIDEISKVGTARKVAERRKNRSVFNILDQCDYQEDAMSGAKLKGFSVTRDNFCSICNAVKPQVNPIRAITVEYDKNSVDIDNVIKRFGANNVKIEGNVISVTHNTFGWSRDNKNILGQLITTYSSQTTAHILDAIKEGAVPNVNDYTFGVYKLFPDMGIDYTTCISFMMQKGVSRIIRAYNDSKSIFTHEYSTPIENAIRSIGKELGLPVYNHTSIEDIITLINNHKDAAEYCKKHNIAKFDINVDLPFNAVRQIKVLSNSNNDSSLFDELVAIIQFKQLKEFADEIGAIARVCNPDKFGAKQSIFATNKVFEDIYELLESQLIPLQGDNGHILNDIYPGINNGATIEEKISNYISKSDDEKSKYKILHTFLKYSTAPSIIINRKLFKTQSTEFRNYLKGFEKYLNDGKRLNEKQNKLLERYIIGELYTKADCLTLPVVYTSNKRRKVNVWDFPEIFDTKEDNVLYEISRLFGYRKSSEPQREIRVKKIDDETKEEKEIIQIVPFYIDNIINPSEEDLKAFSQLTPAQKVHFIQTNFSNGGISKYLNVNLFNVKTVTGKATGTQTIEFIEDSIHPEDAYIQLQSDFTNKNPLIAMTAYDIIKYAFIVEGYKMSKRGISKAIPNTLLYTKLGVAGIGLVEELNKHFRHLEEVMKTTDTNTNDVYLDFIRSNYKQLNIPLRTVEKQNATQLDFNINSNGFIIIEENQTTLLDKYKLRYEAGTETTLSGERKKKYKPNSTIRLKIDKVEQLYKIEYRPGYYFLYPLNKLEPTEHGLYSINPENNTKKYPNYNFYRQVINAFMADSNKSRDNLSTIINTIDASKFIKEIVKDKQSKNYDKPIDLYRDKPDGFEQHLFNETEKFYKHGDNRNNYKPMFVRYNAASQHLHKEGKNNGQKVTLNIKVGDNTIAYPVTIFRVTTKLLRKIQDTYLADGKENEKIQDKHKLYTYLINTSRELGIKKLVNKNDETGYFVPINDIFAITPDAPADPDISNNPNISFSALSEGRVTDAMDVAGDIYKTVMVSTSTNKDDIDAYDTKRYWESNGVKYTTDDVTSIIKSGAEYMVKRTEHILEKLKYFYKDSDEVYHALNTETAIDALYDNEELRNSYLQLMLEAKALVRNNQSIANISIDNQDSDIQSYLAKIQKCVRELKNTEIINEAQIMFANRHLAKYSTDPLIRHDVLKVLNAFQETSWFDGWIGDMTETNNSLMQIITKIVTSDIHSKQKLANRLVKEVRDKIAKLKKEAADKGQPINWTNIIDDATGMFIQNYNDKLREDRDKLKAKAEETRLAYNNGTGSFRDYYLAKHEYDMWKAKHINQIADPEYYDKKVALEHKMLFGKKYTQEELQLDPSLSDIPAYDDVFLKYKELSHKRGEIYSHMTNGYLDQVYLDELEKLNKEINNLISETHTDPITGEYKPYREEYDPLFNPLQGTAEQKRIRRMYSGPSQRAITQYIAEAKQLEKDYFQRDTEIGFQEELNKHIKIITHYERRDANGNPTVPMSLLMDKPDYVASKQWVAHNAIYVLNDEHKEKLNEARKEISRPASRIKFKELVEKREAKDDLGVIDGRVFTDEEIQTIRNEQEGNILFDENTPYNERGLLKNVRPDTTIYTHRFYANMKLEGTSNSDYQRIIGMINTLLQPYWNGATQLIEFQQIPEGEIDCSHFNELRNRSIYTKIFEDLEISDIKTGIDLYTTLEKLYEALSHTKRRNNTDSEKAKSVSKFIREHTITVIPDEAQVEFDKQLAIAETKGDRYAHAWRAANIMIVDDQPVPNPYIYGRFEPIESEKENYTDKKKTEAINLISSTYMSVPTEYYYMKLEEMIKLNDEKAFKKWFRMNHIFNPSTGVLEPIRCWTTYTYRDGSAANGAYNPKWINTRRNVKKDKRNKNYIEDVGHLLNYKVGTGYDNPKINNQTDSEREFKTYIQDLLYSLVHTDEGRRFLQRGYFPAQSVKTESAGKTAIKEILRTLGWSSHHSGKDTYHDSISYDEDRTINMPLLKLLEQIDPLDAKLIKPVRDENDTDETFAAKEAKYQEDLKALKANNVKAHSAAINHNWEDVLETFIMEACRFNAIQDNKYMLLYGLDTISQMEVYSHKHGGLSSYKKDKLHSTENNPVYQTRKMDNKLYDQVENWIRRILYDEWKEPNGAFTKWASRLQSLTSAQYMMMNIKGGIANVNLGSANILSEAFAREYIGEKAWAKGIGMWHASLMGQLARFDSDTSINETDAIIKWFCVVDYDQHIGKDNKLENPTMKGFRYFNSLMYSPQTIGENYMHNSVLLGMLDDHRIILEQDANGNTIPVFKTLNEYIRDNDRLALLSILNDEQKAEFNQRIEAIKKDANALKDFVWRKNTFVSDYIKGLDHKDKKRYEKAKKQFDKDAETRFKANPTVLSELKLGKDGYMTFTNDGFLAKYNLGYEEGKLTPTLKALSDFRNKVISVNKQIHGSYDKLGQAQVEKKWWGSLLMQYHKHIYPGMLKRWRVKGMYNEHRGTIEKGSYISLIQFLSTPIKDIINKSNLTDGEAQAITGIQAIFRKIFDFIQHYRMYWNLLPDYDKANIKRVNGDMAAILVGIIGAMVLRGIGDDDDEDTIWYNLALYEVDRLSSEAIQFNPLGMFGEAKKLWSTPIAAQSGVEDLISTMGFIVDWMTDDEFNPIYQTGRFAGQNKLMVRIKRRIPIYRGIHTSLFDIKESNRYYKLSENMLGSDIIEDMLEWIEE